MSVHYLVLCIRYSLHVSVIMARSDKSSVSRPDENVSTGRRTRSVRSHYPEIARKLDRQGTVTSLPRSAGTRDVGMNMDCTLIDPAGPWLCLLKSDLPYHRSLNSVAVIVVVAGLVTARVVVF